MTKEEGNILQFTIGAVTGLVSGLVCGLLFAPKAGTEIREDIINKTKELEDYTREKLSSVRYATQGKAKEVAGSIHERANKISLKLDELAKRGTDVLIQDEIQ